MSAAANKRTVLAVVSVLLLAAICIAGPAGGAQRDGVPPNVPANPHVTAATPSSVTVAWGAAADNVAVVGYDVYLGSNRTRVVGTSHVVRKLACGSAFAVGVAAVDAAGNRSRKALMIVSSAPCSDTMPPSVPAGFTQSATSQDAVVLVWQPSADDVGVVSYGLYRELTRVGTTSEPRATLTGLSCGSMDVVAIDAVDAAGNRSVRQQVYVETAACPTRERVAVLSATEASDSSEWVRCAGEGQRCDFSGTSEVRYGANGTWTSPRSFTNGVSCTNKVFGDPLYGVVKSCERRSGSPSSTPPPPPPPSHAPPDTSPPAKPILSVGAVGRNTATLNWQPGVDNVGVDHYAVWLDGSLVTRTTGASHTYTDLECDTQYVLGLQVVDAAGNASVLAEALWPIRTTACSSTTTGDSQAPTAPTGLGVSSTTQTSVRLGWSASTDNVGVTGYDVERDGVLATTVTSPDATVAGLTCGTSYGFAVKAFDAAGNRSAEASVVGSTSSCSDAQAPTAPTNVTASTRTATSIVLSWSPSTDNTGVVGYGLYRAGVLIGTTSSPPGIFAGLSCNTNYTLAVDAYDASGNRSPRVTVAAATTACSDTAAPSTPTGLAASSVTQTSLALNWSASTDNVGVAGYDVFRGGTKVATTMATSSAQTGLACATSYGFSVQAFDAAGNRSGQTQLAVTTAPCAPPPPSGGVVPGYADVGAGGTLQSHPGGPLAGTYENRRFTGQVSFGSADVTCVNCRFEGGIATTFPGHGRITLTRCTNTSGWWFEDGGHANVFLDRCLFENSPMQAIRPKGPGTLTATDTWFRSYGTPSSGAHSEAMQTLDGAKMNCTRCAFSQNPVSNNTITGVINDGAGGAGIYTDTVFGNYTPSTGHWSRGGGYYMVYPGQSSFIRPTIYSPAGSASDAWYNGRLPNVLQSPTYIQG